MFGEDTDNREPVTTGGLIMSAIEGAFIGCLIVMGFRLLGWILS